MGNLKYFLERIIKRPLIFIIVILQLSITTSILIPTITIFLDYYDKYKIAENSFNNKNIYSIKLDNDSFRNCMEESFDSDKLYVMYSFLKSDNNFNFLYQLESNIIIKDFCSNDEFYFDLGKYRILNNPYTDVYGNYSNIKAIYLNQKYYNTINLEVEKGRNFIAEDYEESDSTPIILGADYMGIYNVGDTFTYFDYFTKKIKELKVIGILSKDSVFYKSGDIKKFNQYVIAPCMKVSVDDSNSNYLMSGVSECLIETNDKNKAIKDIVNKAKETGVGSYTIESCDKSIKVYLEDCENMFLKSLRTSIIIVLFVFISVTTIQINDIKNRMKEYGVHLLNGAKKFDIVIQNLYTIVCYIICGVGLGYYLEYIRNSKQIIYTNNLRVLLPLIVIFLVFIILVEFILYRKISKIEVNNIIRGVNNESNRDE